jgi:hypothetical protein
VSHRRASDARQADMNRLGAYDDEQPARGTAATRSDVSPAAATPPAATEATRLTATETSYVQAWMKAGERRR